MAKVTQTTNPWSGQAPYLTDLFQQAQSQYNTFSPQYYPESTVAPASPWTMQGAEGAANFGASGYNQGVLANNVGAMNTLAGAQDWAVNPVLGAGLAMTPGATDTLGKITSGQGVNVNNPALDAMVQAAMRQATQSFSEGAMPSISLSALAGGSYGGSRQGIAEGLAGGRLAQALGDIGTNMYGNAYEGTQNRALQGAQVGLGQLNAGYGTSMDAARLAASLAPTMQSSGNYGNELATQAGSLDQQQTQSQLDDLVARWNFYQNLPQQQLQNYASTVYGAGSPGSESTQKMPGQSKVLGALGGAASGAAIGAQFGGFGAIPGAILGGLGGLFG